MILEHGSHLYKFAQTLSRIATISFNVQNEGSSTSRPPFFDGNDYASWKTMIIIHVQSIDYDLCLSIKNGSHKHTRTENGVTIPKDMNEYMDGDKNYFL